MYLQFGLDTFYFDKKKALDVIVTNNLSNDREKFY